MKESQCYKTIETFHVHIHEILYGPPSMLANLGICQFMKFTHLWEYICVFCCEHEPTLNDETGTGNNELGEILVGEIRPGFAVDVGKVDCEEVMLWLLWDGGKSGWACRKLLFTGCAFEGCWDFECGEAFVEEFKVPGILKLHTNLYLTYCKHECSVTRIWVLCNS